MRFLSVIVLLFPLLSLAAVAAEEPDEPSYERIASESDERIPMTVTRLDFDKDPDGNAIKENADLAEVYVAKGCTLSTSFKESFVARIPYNVGGPSGNGCAANHDPLYQGVMTIRFCKPGDKSVPAAVNVVGFWISHVARGGTAMEAYDNDDQLIAKIESSKDGRDFFAVTSERPIAYLKIVPNPEIDPDFAIDDLFFDTPVPFKEER